MNPTATIPDRQAASTTPPNVTTIADALREAARLAAMQDLLAEREQNLRSWLAARAAAHSAVEGTAFNHPVKGLGRTYVTEPGLHLEPLDRAAFGAWATANHPEAARRRLAVAAERIGHWLNAPGADTEDRVARLRRLVHDPEAVQETILINEAFVRDLETRCAPTDDGAVVDLETGEEVPVRAVPNSTPTLVIKVDRQARRRFTAEPPRHFQLLTQAAWLLPAPVPNEHDEGELRAG
jgi:hypothetical protein